MAFWTFGCLQRSEAARKVCKDVVVVVVVVVLVVVVVVVVVCVYAGWPVLHDQHKTLTRYVRWDCLKTAATLARCLASDRPCMPLDRPWSSILLSHTLRWGILPLVVQGRKLDRDRQVYDTRWGLRILRREGVALDWPGCLLFRPAVHHSHLQCRHRRQGLATSSFLWSYLRTCEPFCFVPCVCCCPI